MMLAQIVIDNNCPSWVPIWICTFSLRGWAVLDLAVAGFIAAVLAIAVYDITHPTWDRR